MEEHPKEVYDTLSKMASAIKKENVGKDKMKYRVLMAKAQNKLYLDMPSDSSFQEVVDYYDKNGTPNERMEAHYLMGCIYRDKKEAPMAMQCYQEAVECADTLSKDCDYVTLFSIYGQMADVFRDQFLHENAIEAFLKYSEFALKAHNLHHYVLGKELMISEYYQMGDTAKAFALTRESSQLYLKYKMPRKAASVFPTIISYYLKNKRYDMARKYLDIMESQSIVYDKNRKIVKGYEYNANYKGIYLLGVGKIDSAEQCFRYLNSSKYKFEAAKGLLAVYRIRHNLDSVIKYSMACENGLDTILADIQTASVAQASSMYNYDRFKAAADKMLLEKVRTEKEEIVLLLSVFALCLLIAYLYKRYKKKMSLKQLEMDQRAKEYQDSIENFQVSRLKEAKELKDKMEKLQVQLQNYKMQYDKIMLSEKNVVVEDDEIYLDFKKMAKGLRSVPMPSAKEWKMLEILVAEKFPVFYGKICNNEEGKKLSLQEWRVCLLTRLHFSNSEIVNILNSTPSSISNAKQMVNHKIFGDNRAGTLYKNMLTIL